MASINFTDFDSKSSLLSGDFLVGYKNDGSAEFRTTLNDIVNYLKNIFVQKNNNPIYVTIDNNGFVMNLNSQENYYFTVDELVNNFKFFIDGLDGFTLQNNFNPADFYDCNLGITTTNLIASDVPSLYVTQKCTLSTINDDYFTLYYYNTGSLVLGFSVSSVNLPPPFITPTPEPTPTPTDTPTSTPTETPSETPTETPSETPTDTPTSTPTETPSETPTETPSETPTETLTETPSEFDSDALDYISRVEIVDGEELEPEIKTAINDFVVDLKSRDLWNKISAACIMAGARTLAGALVPLKGPNPGNNAFTDSDYNRATGLKGDGEQKFLLSNVYNNDIEEDRHLSFYVTEGDYQSYELQPLIGTLNLSLPDKGVNRIHTTNMLNQIIGTLNQKRNGNNIFTACYDPNDPRFIHGLYSITCESYTRSLTALWGNSKTDGWPDCPHDSYSTIDLEDFSSNNNPDYIYIYSDSESGGKTAHRGSWYSIGLHINLFELKDCVDTFFNNLWQIIVPPPKPTPPKPTPTETPTPWNQKALYSANSIPLVVDLDPVNNDIDARYRFDQIGSNCPTLTCYRGTNYDFIVKTNNHPFALRNDLYDVGNNVEGSYNNDPWYGVSDKTIYFTPNENTPDSFVYTDTLYPSNSGMIEIKNYE
jgi:hypothetical protein